MTVHELICKLQEFDAYANAEVLILIDGDASSIENVAVDDTPDGLEVYITF